MSPYTRVLVRYICGYLVLKNIIPDDLGQLVATDPQVSMLVEAGIGAAAAGAVEAWYWLARRCGWKT